MAINQLQEAWIKGAVGRVINPDNAYGLQCVDVADDYIEACFPGVPWNVSLGGVPGAKDFTGLSNKYVRWIPNIPGDHSSIPQRGDIIVWGGSPANQWGHVAVVLSATAHAVTVIQQDGFLQVPAFVGTLPYDGPGTGFCTGWMRPLTTANVAANQRVTVPVGVLERPEPNTSKNHLREFAGGQTLTFKGYVLGERVDGLNAWLVGISGNYFHISGFTKRDVSGLKNLTPPPANQRTLGAARGAYREQPFLDSPVKWELKAGHSYLFDAWAYGDEFEGSRVWFRGAVNKGWTHSKLFTSQSTAGMAQVTITRVPKLTATQRLAGPAGATLRSAPNKNGAVTGTFNPGDVLNFKGYVVAERPYGATSSPHWLVGISGDYVWADGVTDANGKTGVLTGLADLTPKPAPVPPPTPAVPVVPGEPVTPPPPPPGVDEYTFTARWETITRVVPAYIGNLQRGNFPENPTHCLIHQMDDPERNPTLAGTANWFDIARPDAPSSAHMGAEEDELWGFVDTVDRAFHAGPRGNDFLSIEVPPNPSQRTIETVKRFLREFRDVKGYELQLGRHMDYAPTRCGTHVPLEAFSIAGEVPTDLGLTADDIKTAEGIFDRLAEFWRTHKP